MILFLKTLSCAMTAIGSLASISVYQTGHTTDRGSRLSYRYRLSALLGQLATMGAATAIAVSA